VNKSANETERDRHDLTADLPPGVCADDHPLLEGVRCQRLTGHPGKHGAAVDSSSTELTMEWGESAEAAR
jgi:hypothetical protein